LARGAGVGFGVTLKFTGKNKASVVHQPSRIQPLSCSLVGQISLIMREALFLPWGEPVGCYWGGRKGKSKGLLIRRPEVGLVFLRVRRTDPLRIRIREREEEGGCPIGDL